MLLFYMVNIYLDLLTYFNPISEMCISWLLNKLRCFTSDVSLYLEYISSGSNPNHRTLPGPPYLVTHASSLSLHRPKQLPKNLVLSDIYFGLANAHREEVIPKARLLSLFCFFQILVL